MNSSGIIRYNDVINDMTFFSKTKYTKLLMVYQNLSNCGELLSYDRRIEFIQYAG